MINVIKRHKGLAIISLLTIILCLILLAIFARMIFSSNKTEYGDRLNNIVTIDKDRFSTIKKDLEEDKTVEKVTLRTQGKIIYTTIIFNKDASVKSAKAVAEKTIGYYNEEELGCYDFQFLLTQNLEDDEEGNNSSFNIAGSKHVDASSITWSKN